MPNTISKKTLDEMENRIVKELDKEKEILAKMTGKEIVGYMAAKASFSNYG